MPIDWNVNFSDIAAYQRQGLVEEQYRDQQRAEAIRWQGAQEYDALLKSGVSARDAFARTAPKLLYNEPRAMASAAGDFGLGEGEIRTDAATGRQFIVQPNGKISAVPQRWMGSTTVMGPGGQIFKIPLNQAELEQAPRTSVPPPTPRVEPLPEGQGSMIVQPSGTGTRIPTPATEQIRIKDPETGAERVITRGEYAMEKAMKEAGPLLKQYESNKAEIAASNISPGPDFLRRETYAQKNARIASQLASIGFDTSGNVLPNTRLAAEVGPGSAEPTQEQLRQGAGVAAPVVPPAPVPAARNISQFIYNRPGGPVTNTFAGTDLIGSPVAAPAAPVAPLASPAAPVGPPALAPNEVLMTVRGRLAVFDRTTRKFLRYAR